MHLDQFKAYFTDWKQQWYFAKPHDTDNLLEEIGYVNRTVYLYSDCVILPNRRIYSKFVKTVVMKPYLGRLLSRRNARWFLDYVRLNIVAHRS